MGETAGTNTFMTLLLSGVIGMLLLAVSVIVFFVIYQRRLLAQQQLREAEARNHQKALLLASVDIQEKERRRIASDLHDDIGSKLSAARLYLQELDTDQSRKRNQELKEGALTILANILNSARRITHDLFPPELEKFGLFAAAEDLCESIGQGGKVDIDFVTELTDLAIAGKPTRLAVNIELALYRVLQELINNTLKHARANTITVHFKKISDRLYFNYQDDGQGYDSSNLKAGLGLRNIETRVTLIGGSLQFISSPGKGTRLDVEVPIPEWTQTD